ncbi:MAG: OmpA family protein, partial [Candidatus Saccharibacteria bacterium]|nr:OmpA family protein [Moraxellaceae bacterium]
FDEQMKVSGSYFDRPACVLHLQPLPAGPVLETEAPVVALPTNTQLSLPTNRLFGFNQSKLNDLPESFRGTLRSFAEQLKANMTTLESITIIGHTDRLGNDEQNLKLSTARAETIKEFFVLQGIDAEKIKAEGQGSTAPLTECTDKNRKKLIDCLAPNRRVDIEFKQK